MGEKHLLIYLLLHTGNVFLNSSRSLLVLLFHQKVLKLLFGLIFPCFFAKPSGNHKEHQPWAAWRVCFPLKDSKNVHLKLIVEDIFIM